MMRALYFLIALAVVTVSADAKILAIHRTKPNWPADPARPIFERAFGGTTYYVETDGAAPTPAEIDAVLNPPVVVVAPDPIDQLRAALKADPTLLGKITGK